MTWKNQATKNAYDITQNYEDLYFGIKDIMISRKCENTKIRSLCQGRVLETYYIKWDQIVERYKEEFEEDILKSRLREIQEKKNL